MGTRTFQIDDTRLPCRADRPTVLVHDVAGTTANACVELNRGSAIATSSVTTIAHWMLSMPPGEAGQR